jgi:hypothetical protein
MSSCGTCKYWGHVGLPTVDKYNLDNQRYGFCNWHVNREGLPVVLDRVKATGELDGFNCPAYEDGSFTWDQLHARNAFAGSGSFLLVHKK